MLFKDYLVLIRGGGDLATGTIYRLHKSGFPVVVLELERPLVVRRQVAVATAVLQDQLRIEDMIARRAATPEEALLMADAGIIPVLVSPQLPEWDASPTILIDARMVKRNIDTHKEQAPFVIALGPGFNAGEDCHAVIETMRGHTLGRVIWEGPAIPNTGTPGIVAGKGAERVLRAPVEGVVHWQFDIGDKVMQGNVLGNIDGTAITAPFDGVLRGLIAPDTAVPQGMKIGDLDARADPAACFTISDKALAVGGGVLEAILTFITNHKLRDRGRNS
jgi:xanthine dehydrogenase accessory factor